MKQLLRWCASLCEYKVTTLKGTAGAGKPLRGHSCKCSWELKMAVFSVPLMLKRETLLITAGCIQHPGILILL